jgi:hypothetical protein
VLGAQLNAIDRRILSDMQGLLKELPKAGTAWPEEQRKLWRDTAASIFKMIYKDASPEAAHAGYKIDLDEK